VKELFRFLDADESGNLEFEEIALLLTEVLNPPCSEEQIEAIYELTEKREDDTITCEEFYKAVKGPLKKTMKQHQKTSRLKHELQQRFEFAAPVTRNLMVDSLKETISRDDAFRTLPSTLMYISIFTFLAVVHLKIYERQQLERGLEAWMESYGSQFLGPYLGSVADISGMFGWLVASGIPAVLGECRSDFRGTGDVTCPVGTRSVLVGDIALKQKKRDGSDASVWLLHSEQSLAHLQLNPGDYLGAAIETSNHLHQIERWADEDTTDLELCFATYGVRSQLFGVTCSTVRMDDFGYVSPFSSAQAVVTSPYPQEIYISIIYLVFDGLYIVFIITPLYNELKDIFHAVRLSGCADGINSYWGFWNAVDWLSIVTGIVSITLWFFCCQAMWTDSITGIVVEDGQGKILAPGVMGLPVVALEQLHEDFKSIISLFNIMRITMGCTACTIMMKFFKAFQANARLRVVTNTMSKAASDIVHFSVVFISVFLVFALTGHIFFGNDLKEFRDLPSSIDTCFITLMGGFEWYATASESDQGLASGMPNGLLVAWFWLYMIFVLMILLNMLLAIILDHYTELVGQIKMDIDVPALWEQAFRYIAHVKKTKAHIPLTHLLTLVQDDDAECHTEDNVTTSSLQEAFPEMTSDQAEHLMEWLQAEAKKKMFEKEDEIMARLKALAAHVDTVDEDLNVVKLNAAVCTSRLRAIIKTADPESPTWGKPSPRTSVKQSPRRPSQSPRPSMAARKSAMSPSIFGQQEEDIIDQIDQLTLRVGSSIRELTGRINTATDDLSNKPANGFYGSSEMTEASFPQINDKSSSGRIMPTCLSRSRE
jgi:hypothetical protein